VAVMDVRVACGAMGTALQNASHAMVRDTAIAAIAVDLVKLNMSWGYRSHGAYKRIG